MNHLEALAKADKQADSDAHELAALRWWVGLTSGTWGSVSSNRGVERFVEYNHVRCCAPTTVAAIVALYDKVACPPSEKLEHEEGCEDA